MSNSVSEHDHCDRCDCVLSDYGAMRYRIAYYAVNDPPIGTYEVEAPEETWEELIAAMSRKSAADNEADVSQRGSLLLCADCYKLWSAYMRARPLSREAPDCAFCPGEIPVFREDLWMVWYRAAAGNAGGSWVAVSPGEVSRRFKALNGEHTEDNPVDEITEGLAELKLVCLCAGCYRDWIHDPASTPDLWLDEEQSAS